MRGRFSGVSAVLFSAALAMAGQAYASTISNYSISTSAQGGPPCSMSGSGPATASCSSTNGGIFHANASVTLTDNSIVLSLGSHMVSGALGFASITHDDFYSVPVNGPVSVVEQLGCTTSGLPPLQGHFSLGSTSVSPPVETIWMGASQGSGPCGGPWRISLGPPGFEDNYVVSLVAANNIVHLHTYIEASGFVVDDASAISVQLTVLGFQDANGNPITATLVPEPNTWLTLGLGLLIAALTQRLRR